MWKQRKAVIVSALVFIVVLSSLFSIGFVFAKSANSQHTTQAHPVVAGKHAAITPSFAHAIDMANVPAVQASSASSRAVILPMQMGMSAKLYAERKAGAAHSGKAPKGSYAYTTPGAVSKDTPSATAHFHGMSDSPSICPPYGCQPPDQALATSVKYVFQGVNTSFAVYNPSGALQSGWPKNAQNFFSVPSPGSCDPSGPFLSDPRAFYDPNDSRFWAATLQVEGAFGIPCPFTSIYWIAYSLTSSPTGTWCSYGFPMTLGTNNAADYTQLGFDKQDVYFSGNMFDASSGNYSYAEMFGFTKPSAKNTSSCASLSAYGFYNLTTPDGVLADTVQPVLTEASINAGPNAGLFISSYNINSGGGVCSSGCSNVVVWALGNPGTSSEFLTNRIVSTASYALAPSADEPGCGQCIETLDTRISGTPVYHNGLISFALETGIYNGSQTVPGILWGQVSPFLDDSGNLTGSSLYQNGYYYYGNDGAASFGTLMPDLAGDLFMVFEFMNGSINPEVAYTARRVTLYPGTFHDGGVVLRSGDAPTFDSRWGDYEAASYDGSSPDDVWFSGQFSAASGDWSTYIGKDKFCSSCY